ncbi:MAG TPA: hypothetical protein VE621_01895 [Bryobacteraceae bacterium]|jgi:hypothetical protein|nr:hypothetical protein [Bryobacteraceae bacterium]
MTAPNGWRCVELISHLLSPSEREMVLGDLAEAGESGTQAFFSVTGLILRRQASLWRNWRPWLAAFGLAVPCSFLLMGLSFSIAGSYQLLTGSTMRRATAYTVEPGLLMLLCNIGLLAAWSWTGGFAVGTISRRTTWVSATVSLLACSFCLARFNVECLSRLCLLLFLPPAVAGLYFGLRTTRIRFGAALTVAVIITALTFPQWSRPGAWLPNWALSWPAWYLVAIASRQQSRWRNGVNGE